MFGEAEYAWQIRLAEEIMEENRSVLRDLSR